MAACRQTGLQSWEAVPFCCSKLPGLWSSVTAVPDTNSIADAPTPLQGHLEPSGPPHPRAPRLPGLQGSQQGVSWSAAGVSLSS